MTSQSLMVQADRYSNQTISLKDYLKLKKIALFGIFQYLAITAYSMYSFSNEFTLMGSWISEFGNKFLENGEVNTTPRYLWATTTFLMSVCLLVYFYKIPKTNKLTERVSWLFVFGSPFLAISGVIPRDTERLLHDRSVAAFYILCSLAILILSIQLIRLRKMTILGYAGVAMSCASTFYMIGALLPFAQSPWRKIAQKILSYSVQTWLIFYIYNDPLNDPKIVE